MPRCCCIRTGSFEPADSSSRTSTSCRVWIVALIVVGISAAPTVAQCWGWSEHSTPVHPAGRYDHGIAYDSARQRVVIFGGTNGAGGGAGPHLNDTWEWDGVSWTQRFPASQPSARIYNQMVYSRQLGVILFGGAESMTLDVLDDAWRWDGTSWSELPISPMQRPTERYGHGMAANGSGIVILFGGGAAGGGSLNDTWEFNGESWIQRSPAHQPSGRYFLGGNGLAYDAGRDVVVLFGGRVPLGSFLDDTWEWNGTDWVERFPANHPSARDGHALAFVPGSGVVLFGGHSGSFRDDTWVWDGSDWTELALPSRPAGRHRHSMVYDSTMNETILFGGWDFSTSFDDTWELSGGSPPCCGDGSCAGDEDVCNCPTDCGPTVCGDGCCVGGENSCNCVADCGPTWCGDGCCGPDEVDCRCPIDCPGDCPIPTVSEWGLIVILLLVLAAGSIELQRRAPGTEP